MRRTPSLREAAEAPRCVSAIAYNTCSGESATVADPSLLQLPRCAAADTTWPKEKKARRPDSAAGRTVVRPQRKKKKLDANQSCGRRLIYVQGCHENCDGSTTSGYALRRRMQGRHGGAATRPTIT